MEEPFKNINNTDASTEPRHAHLPKTSMICPPKVHVAAERVIRTMAGLRPYRAGGFVVRAEPLSGRRLVHNYGHGGAGIALSWGSSKLAVDLGLAGHSGPVAVIGAGVMGLSTARLVQEAGFEVTMYNRSPPPYTTSNIAGGQWYPHLLFDEKTVTAKWREQYVSAAAYSWRRFQTLVGDDYSIRWLPTYTEPRLVEQPLFSGFPLNARILTRDEHPFAMDQVAAYDTMYVETGRYLRQLVHDMQSAGGRIQIQNFATRTDIAALPEQLIFNCTGLGAHQLFGDSELIPVRGQLAVLLPQPEIRYAYLFDGGYMFPRPDGIVLGGTVEEGVWDAGTQPDTISEILTFHQRLFTDFP